MHMAFATDRLAHLVPLPALFCLAWSFAGSHALAPMRQGNSGKAGLTRRNPVDDTFPYHDHRCMGTA